MLLFQFRNDYTNIRNHLDAITLGAYQAVKTTLTLAGNLDGTVTLEGKGGGSNKTWMTWSFFPNTGQLRNQYERAVCVCVCVCVCTCQILTHCPPPLSALHSHFPSDIRRTLLLVSRSA